MSLPLNTPAEPPSRTKGTGGRITTLYHQTLTRLSAAVTVNAVALLGVKNKDTRKK